MSRIAVGEQKDNGQALGATAAQLLRDGSQLPFVERPQHIAVGIEALIHFETQRVAGQQRGTLLVKPIEVRTVLPSDHQHVGKARRRQQRSDGAAAFEQGIRSHGHAVDDHETR